MSERIVFGSSAAASSISFEELGKAPDGLGAWGVVDDQQWLASRAADGFELLYLSRGDFQYAVRGLTPEGVVGVVEQRRRTFARETPALALGLVESGVRACAGGLGAGPRAAAVRADLLTALASFTLVPRFANTAPVDLLDYLQEGEAEILAELESQSLRTAEDLDPGGQEQQARRQFAAELGELGARRGRPAMAQGLPYIDIQRAYWVTPATPDLARRAEMLGDPTLPFGDGLIMPVPERLVAEMGAAGHRATVVFPAARQLVGMMSSLTPEQLQVTVSERLASPGFATYLQALRLQQATLRTAVRLITGTDREFSNLLIRQTSEEANALGAWSGRSAARTASPADDLAQTIATATFLVELSRRRGRDAIANRLEGLRRALSHVAAGMETS